MPIGLGVVGIAFELPCGDFLDEDLFIGDPAVEALGRKHPEFGLCQIKPTTVLWSVVPLCAAENYGGRSNDLTT